MVWAESASNPNAMRYESKYRWTLDIEIHARANNISQATEETCQKTSWGLMQVMGGVARELGMTDELVKLTKPNIGLEFGCRKLAQLYKKYASVLDVIAAYNAGSPRRNNADEYVNKYYVDKVYGLYHELKFGR